MQGRKAENITHVRAFFVDLDGAPGAGSGRTNHAAYCRREFAQTVSRLLACGGLPAGSFRPIQKALAARFDGDSSVNDLPRIMRAYLGFIIESVSRSDADSCDEPGDVTLAEFSKPLVSTRRKTAAKLHRTRCIVINGQLESNNSCKIAAVAAERTASKHRVQAFAIIVDWWRRWRV